MSELTAGELEMMQVLWEHGDQKPAEIQARYPRSIKNAALRFQLRVLLEKGHVARRKVGKAYFYEAITQRRGVLRNMTRRMANVFGGGSAAGLIAELIRAEALSADDIDALRHFAEGDRDKERSGD